MSIKIDKEFERLIPPLSAEEFAQLEANCLREGIRDPLVVWAVPNGDQILIDGHNRLKISVNHSGIPFEIKQMQFDTRTEAEEWILRNQLGRRNVDKWVRLGMAKRLEEIEKQKGRKRMSDARKGTQISAELKGETRDKMAEMVGVSHDTYTKMKAIDASDNEEIKAAARSGEISVNKAFEQIKAENAALKRKVQELEGREPEVRVERVEVIPEDYEKTKKDLEFARYTAERAEKDFQKMRQKYEDARSKAEQLAEKIGESTEAAKAERDIQYFTTATNDYIRRYGGHVWAFNEIQNVDETVRTDYLKAIKALDAFAQQMITNIEGGIL